MYVVIDIETCRNEQAEEYFLSGRASPDRRLVDPKKIKESLDKQYEKCGLSWWLGKVCGISACTMNYEQRFNGFSEDEKTLLSEFATFLLTLDYPAEVVLVGKNSKSFDFPFLTGRFMRHDLGVPYIMMKRNHISDVDEIWAPYSRNEQTTSLDNYAWGLQIEGKLDGFNGSMVQGMYDRKEWDKMRTYCNRDRDIVAEILRRYRPFDGGKP